MASTCPFPGTGLRWTSGVLLPSAGKTRSLLFGGFFLSSRPSLKAAETPWTAPSRVFWWWSVHDVRFLIWMPCLYKEAALPPICKHGKGCSLGLASAYLFPYHEIPKILWALLCPGETEDVAPQCIGKMSFATCKELQEGLYFSLHRRVVVCIRKIPLKCSHTSLSLKNWADAEFKVFSTQLQS